MAVCVPMFREGKLFMQRWLCATIVVSIPGIGAALPDEHIAEQAVEASEPELADEEDEQWRSEAMRSYEMRALFSAEGEEWSPPRLGNAKEPLGPATFYETVGMAEYASEYRLNRAIRYGLVGVGTAVAIGSLLYGVSEGSGAIDAEGQSTEEGDSRLLVGLLGVLGGVGVAMCSSLVTSDSIAVETRRELEQKYNDALLDELGLIPAEVQWLHDERAVRERAKNQNHAELSVAPLIGSRNRGMSLTIGF